MILILNFIHYLYQIIWVAAVEKQLQMYPNVVITDCRFPNEIEMLINCLSIIIKITTIEVAIEMSLAYKLQ